jgi:hypothetical protein
LSCEHLICAACAGPVVDGRCPVCRAGRAAVHHRWAGMAPAQWLLVLLVLLVALLAALAISRPGL